MNLKKLATGSLCFCLAMFSTMAFAQTKEISGKVTDSKDGSAVPGITVQGTTSKGKKIGTATGTDGTFKLSSPDEISKVILSGAGFEKQEISTDGKPTVNASMVASNTSLNEVVVIGYGTARQKDVTGSVASLKSKDFNQGIITSPDQLLQNKVAGLDITSNNGQPGSATTVKVRGNNSIRAVNNPLYVVDGVPLDGRSARPSVNLGANGLGFGSTPDNSPLTFINPADIDRIDVLKDASSAAIYGSRGANGVIVITTKKATSGATKLEFGANFGTNVGYMKKYDVLSASQFRTALSKYKLDTLITSLDKGSSVDALKAITQSTLSQNYSLALSGGNETSKFRASFLGSTNKGFIKNTSLDKYIGNFEGQFKLLDKKLSIDYGLIAAHTTENIANVSNTAGSAGNLISAALSWNPTEAFKDAAGRYVVPSNGSGNPISLLDAYSDVANVNTFLANISATYNIIKGLDYKFLYAINHSTGDRNTNIDGFIKGQIPVSGQGYGVISGAKLSSQTFTHTLNYKTYLGGKFNLDAVAGYEYFKTDYSNNSFAGLGFNTNLSELNLLPIKYTDILTDAKTLFPASTFKDVTTELQSYFGRATLNYNDKYYLTGTFRADGSSKFGSNNKYGYFPAVGGKWNISNEDFMKNSKVFSNLSLRGSFGITGNQEFPAGAATAQYGFSAYNTFGQTVVYNPNLKWEKTTSTDVGFDFSILKNVLNGTVDFYNKNTTNLIYQATAIQPAPNSIYFINLPANLINRGVEISLSATIIQKTDFSLDLGGNIAFNKNNLTHFTDLNTGKALLIQTGAINGQGVSGTFSQVITNNKPANEFYLKPFGGFDKDGNQIIGANPQFAGDPNPHYVYGLNTNIRFKKLTLTINGGGSGGNLIYNNTSTAITNLSGLASGRNVDLQAYNSAEKLTSAVGASTRFLESGNFFKLRNASLRYNIGNAGKYIKNLSAFVSGSNLFVITKFHGFDPEVNVDKNNNNYPSRSIEYIPYPTPRIISFGFNFSL